MIKKHLLITFLSTASLFLILNPGSGLLFWGGAALVFLSLAMTLANRGADWLLGNIIGALLLLSHVGNVRMVIIPLWHLIGFYLLGWLKQRTFPKTLAKQQKF